MRTSDGGFTLFEVLGAVAVLAILYTTLSTVAIRALRSEGESRRMLEASMIADWELSAFELELEKGAAPELGVTENEELGGYAVVWEVTPLQTPIFGDAGGPQRGAPAAGAAQATATSQSAAAQFTAAQLAAANAEAPPFLQVDLRVSWFEAGYERSVTRTIFAVDEDAAAKLAAENLLRDDAEERR